MIQKSEIADGWGKDALERGKSQVNERSRRDYGKEYDYIGSFLLFYSPTKQSTTMKKEFRMFAGILLHPVKMIAQKFYRKSDNCKLLQAARRRQFEKNHERMHAMSQLTNTAYTQSPLYLNLYAGAPEWRHYC